MPFSLRVGIAQKACPSIWFMCNAAYEQPNGAAVTDIAYLSSPRHPLLLVPCYLGPPSGHEACLHKILRIRRLCRTFFAFRLCPFAFLRHNARLSGHNVCLYGLGNGIGIGLLSGFVSWWLRWLGGLLACWLGGLLACGPCPVPILIPSPYLLSQHCCWIMLCQSGACWFLYCFFFCFLCCVWTGFGSCSGWTFAREDDKRPGQNIWLWHVCSVVCG